MQLAGKSCSLCHENVVLDADATWCARCTSVVHRDCLAKSDGICPTCRKTLDHPEAYFVFSKLCPECFRPNDPPQPVCPRCLTRTRWDNQPAYDHFVAGLRDTARDCAFEGVAELAGGFVRLLALAAMFLSSTPLILPVGALLFGFALLTLDGLLKLAQGRRLARFR